MSKILKLKNYHLIFSESGLSLTSFLGLEKLHGLQSRSRSRFIKLINERVEEVNKERDNLLKEYCKKDKEKKIIYLDKDGKETTDTKLGVRYSINEKDITKIDEEYKKYLLEEFVIDVTPANTETITNTKKVLLNSLQDVSGRQSAMYDEWCEAFEAVKEVKESKK